MSGLSIFWLVLTGTIFAAWAAQMFHSLFRLSRAARARAEARGAMWPSIREQLGSYRAFLTAPDFARDRRRLMALTLALFVIIALRLAVLPPG